MVHAEAVDLAPMIEQLAELVNVDAALVRRGRNLTVDVLLEVGAAPYYVSIDGGRIVSIERGPLVMRSWSFAIRGNEQAWRQFWLPFPPPHFHDLFALAKRGELRIEGDLYPLMTHLLYFKGVLAAPRRLSRGRALMPARIDPIVGRYLHVTLQQRPHRLYFEEAGTGIPLVCLHTAGSDGRQFRHLMTDAAITEHFRVIAFDLPWHGKSTPPDGWQDEEYRLTTASYTEAIRSLLCRARARPAGRARLLDRRADRAQPRHSSRRRVPGADRIGSPRPSRRLGTTPAGCTGRTSTAARSAPGSSPA